MTQERKQTRDDLFQADEMALLSVDNHWTPEELLAKEGIFFLKDVVKVLALDPLKVKRRAREIADKGKNAWQVMGTRKVWNHWIVRMKVFGPYYTKHLIPKVKTVNPEWDGNELLRQKGLFLLTDVCKLIPFSTHQLRYQAKRNPNAKREYGVWKDQELNAFVVEMERFAPWIFSLWEGKHRKR